MRGLALPCLVALVALVGAAHAAPDPGPDPTGIEQHLFDSLLGKAPELSAEQVLAALPAAGFVDKIAFDVTKAKHYDAVVKYLGLDAAAKARLAKTGVLSVNTGRRYSMGSAYNDLYMKDMPVLVTTDSVLHAIHRSFDASLAELESQVFLPTMRDLLMSTRERLKVADKDVAAEVGVALRDAELYLTVALNLMRGAGGPAGDQWTGWDGKIQVVSAMGQDEAVLALLRKVQAGELEQRPGTEIYGGMRAVDWSQFTPRGHYTLTADLQHYFRALMWLGRADTGFNVLNPAAGAQGDPVRERRAAAALVLALVQTRSDARLREIDTLIAFLIGQSDNLGVDDLQDLLKRAGIKAFGDLADAKKDAALVAALEATGLAAQRIRSQAVVSYPEDPTKVAPPALFQVFGQRFLIDSFVLSQVVFDSILYQGKKSERMMPSGLDVMAALGNDEAVRLLEPELRKWQYGANLTAARDLVGLYPARAWQQNQYQRWLAGLRTLNALPTGKLPQAMKTQAWARKALRTQLGSWAELRHDTILYGKQSYSAVAGCEYPAGFVEPYPAFYAAFAEMAAAAAGHMARLEKSADDRTKPIAAAQAAYWLRAVGLLKKLEGMARKELAGKPFSAEETAWIKKTIDKRGGGSGPPRYDGWYPDLYYGAAPDKWVPTVADVHTDPNSKSVLEVAVGDAELLVLAVDNGSDHALYVGPSYSYYEWAEPGMERLTDEAWQQRLQAGDGSGAEPAPAQPNWTAPLVR